MDGKKYIEKKFFLAPGSLFHIREIDERYIIVSQMEGTYVTTITTVSSNMVTEDEKNSFMNDWNENRHRFSQ